MVCAGWLVAEFLGSVRATRCSQPLTCSMAPSSGRLPNWYHTSCKISSASSSEIYPAAHESKQLFAVLLHGLDEGLLVGRGHGGDKGRLVRKTIQPRALL